METNLKNSNAVRLAAMTKTAFVKRHRRIDPLITAFENASTEADTRIFAGELLAEVKLADRSYRRRMEKALDTDEDVERGD